MWHCVERSKEKDSRGGAQRGVVQLLSAWGETSKFQSYQYRVVVLWMNSFLIWRKIWKNKVSNKIPQFKFLPYLSLLSSKIYYKSVLIRLGVTCFPSSAEQPNGAALCAATQILFFASFNAIKSIWLKICEMIFFWYIEYCVKRGLTRGRSTIAFQACSSIKTKRLQHMTTALNGWSKQDWKMIQCASTKLSIEAHKERTLRK